MPDHVLEVADGIELFVSLTPGRQTRTEPSSSCTASASIQAAMLM
jgi:hypothetical protein